MSTCRSALLVAMIVCVAGAVVLGDVGARVQTPVKVEAEAVKAIPGITAENYPSVNGSTSTTPLSHLLALRALGIRGKFRPATNAERMFGGPLLRVVPHGGRIMAEPHVLPRHEGTHGAYVSLIGAKSHMILVARGPSEDELKAAAEQKVELDVRPRGECALLRLQHTSDRFVQVYDPRLVLAAARERQHLERKFTCLLPRL